MMLRLNEIVAGMSEDDILGVQAMASRPEEVSRPEPSRDTQRAVLAQEAARLARRLGKLETEAIRLARPLPHVASFHESRKQIRILSGSNQSAKTYHEVLEIGRAITGQDPYKKYPKHNGRAILVGYDGDHLSDPFYQKLFLPGEFKIIRDERTRKWRAVRPDPADPRRLDPYDLAYQEQWRDAPPFVPPRMVASVAWEVASKRIPRNITLTNGWQTLWRSSNSRPPRGRQVHLVALDEDLRNTNAWVNEMIPRLVKHAARMIWAATAQEGGPELYELCQKADAGSAHVGFHRLLIADNPFISDEQRAFFLDTLTSEEERAVRYYGENALAVRLVYRDYDPNGMHGCEPFAIPAHKWARYVVLDPGRQHCGTLFLAVDPQEKHVYVYDAMDLRNSDATRWAHEVAARQMGMKFEAVIVDQRMGKQTHVGREYLKNVARQYWEALVEAGVEPRRRGVDPRLGGCFPGSDDVDAREETLLSWLQPRPIGSPFAGTPRLQVFRGMSPELDRQIRLASRDYANHKEKRAAQQEDLLVCLEYAAAFNPGFHSPEPAIRSDTAMPITIPERPAQKQALANRRRGRSQQAFGTRMQIGG
jgi:hypothetical protein